MTLPGEEDWEDRPPAPALRMLLAFERLLVERALPGRSVDPWWVGSNDPIPLLRLVDDLAGALLCSYRDTRPLYHLQIPFFPVTPHRLPETARTRWCFASPQIRRALFAVVLTLTGPEEVRAAFTGLKRGPRRRSQGWPPSVRDRWRRAFRSPRLRHRLSQQRLAVPELRNSTRSDWPILTI